MVPVRCKRLLGRWRLRRASLVAFITFAVLPLAVPVANATHGGTLGGSTDGPGVQRNVHGFSQTRPGYGGDTDVPTALNNARAPFDANPEGCVPYSQITFEVLYATGTFSNGTTTYNATNGRIEGQVIVNSDVLYEGPSGSYDGTTQGPTQQVGYDDGTGNPPNAREVNSGPGCNSASAGSSNVPATSIRAIFRQVRTTPLVPPSLVPICDTTNSSSTNPPSLKRSQVFWTINNVQCGTHFYTMQATLRAVDAQYTAGTCVGPAAPLACEVKNSQLG